MIKIKSTAIFRLLLLEKLENKIAIAFNWFFSNNAQKSGQLTYKSNWNLFVFTNHFQSNTNTLGMKNIATKSYSCKIIVVHEPWVNLINI